ncbi:TetR/AcrR family transcriptional regulator [Acidipropionibacterium virtanenii]|uniref:HTH-type transcriptional regulator BetI n=1 Tax=Acidipropionibacterium virtanenii TaxID=2057246 RepID=A0A344UV28_9ACTN|nr:TetR family transcriptional regulator C-terminal domain-containing protein [Acidipropionibacterium virtanenii]AXE39126.1 HTH-type transcriptional regulator BetI [Acidipropionibacterium virtanenii]
MPKIVDPQQRRAEIADALFAVLREGGVSKITLAGVAERAGLAIGSVRHFLGTHEEMMVFAFDTISERFRDRVLSRARALRADLDGGGLGPEARLGATADLLCEFLPMDGARRDEAVVWVEFEVAARTDPRLAETSTRAAARTAHLIGTILESIRARGDLGLDLALEAARLSALLDGLTLRSVLHPDLLGPDVMRRVVVEHLEALRGMRPARARDDRDSADGSSVRGEHSASAT